MDKGRYALALGKVPQAGDGHKFVGHFGRTWMFYCCGGCWDGRREKCPVFHECFTLNVLGDYSKIDPERRKAAIEELDKWLEKFKKDST